MRKLKNFKVKNKKLLLQCIFVGPIFLYPPPPASILAQWRGETDQWILYKETLKKIYYVDKVLWAGI